MMPIVGDYLKWSDDVPPEGSIVEDSDGKLWERISDYSISWQRQHDDWYWNKYPWGPDLESWFYVNNFVPLKLIRWGCDY